jgi:AbiU2
MEKGLPPLRIINSRATFDRLLDHLATEERRAGDHWYLWGTLDAAFDDYCKELNQAPQFWRLTRLALQDSVILRLERLFDPTNGALSLGNFLKTIHNHAGNHSLSSLGLDVPGLDTVAIQEELKRLSNDPLISRLMQVRNQYLAHRQASLVSRGTFASLPELRREDIAALLNSASTIVDKYCRLYERPLMSVRFVGADDYKYLLDLLKVGLESIEAKHADEIRRLLHP